jgi:DUF1680 family protein
MMRNRGRAASTQAAAALIAMLVAPCLANPRATVGAEPRSDYPIRPVPITAVKVADRFWAPRLETNRRVTLPYDFKKCEETGRIDNFAKAGGLMSGEFRGIFFDDSDVFKVIEGASYSLALHPDPQLDAYLDDLIAKIAAAQEDDGYLYTARTLNPQRPPPGSGAKRWSGLVSSHELYNVGHLYEAAVAHFQATGKRALLDVAIKNADLIDRTFGPDRLRGVPGHQEIEIGLIKIYRTTGDERYLRLAKFFLDQRGRSDGHKLYGPNAQDHQPVVDQTEAVGHAVRAAYMYCGMADIAALTADASYIRSLDGLWRNVVERKLYLTGGIGARRAGEAFGDDYELPNKGAYAETCAAIANALWNHRMFLLHGEGKYIDILERVLYNGFLSGVALSGDRFFYTNPLEADGVSPHNQGSPDRQPWFACACCPVNDVRFIPSIAGQVYAMRDDSLYVNLFIGGSATVPLAGGEVKVEQQTEYPWQGKIRIQVDPGAAREFALHVRIPGWARGEALPGGLYQFLDPPGAAPAAANDAVILRLNGNVAPIQIERGYAVIRRSWKPGDSVELELAMPVRRVVADEKVSADRGRVALQRGPIVYCIEAIDHGGAVRDVFLSDKTPLEAAHDPQLLGGMMAVRGPGERLARSEAGEDVQPVPFPLVAVPYYAWNHRGTGEMVVWLPRTAELAQPAPLPTVASRSRPSASHVGPQDTLNALHDQLEPRSSADHDIPRFTWWDRRGTSEWVEYDFAMPRKISSVEVYWFDDEPQGGKCRVPKSWRVAVRNGETWSPLGGDLRYETAKDRYSVVTFAPVSATAVRIEADLRDGFSAGILEWRVR